MDRGKGEWRPGHTPALTFPRQIMIFEKGDDRSTTPRLVITARLGSGQGGKTKQRICSLTTTLEPKWPRRNETMIDSMMTLCRYIQECIPHNLHHHINHHLDQKIQVSHWARLSLWSCPHGTSFPSHRRPTLHPQKRAAYGRHTKNLLPVTPWVLTATPGCGTPGCPVSPEP